MTTYIFLYYVSINKLVIFNIFVFLKFYTSFTSDLPIITVLEYSDSSYIFTISNAFYVLYALWLLISILLFQLEELSLMFRLGSVELLQFLFV